MITAAEYARKNRIPYFGICLGMQIAVIEYARNEAGLPEAHSGEFDEQCRDKVIDFMPGQSDDIDKEAHSDLKLPLCDSAGNTNGALLSALGHSRAPSSPLRIK